MTSAPIGSDRNPDVSLGSLADGELDAVLNLVATAFHQPADRSEREREEALLEPGRCTVIRSGSSVVATSTIASRALTIPGRELAVAAVTNVVVARGWTRRGLLSRMMHHQLDTLHETQAEPVAVLTASETPIYRRFGYGLTTDNLRVTARKRRLELRPEANELADAADDLIDAPIGGDDAEAVRLRADLVTVYDRVRREARGHLDRTEPWWGGRLHDPEYAREGARPLRAVVIYCDGAPEAYALYTTNGNTASEGMSGNLDVREVMATGPVGRNAVWRFLLSVDLLDTMTRRCAPVDDPIVEMLSDRRAWRGTVDDGVWARLVDVDRALVARSYRAETDVVIDIDDDTCPWNAGRWRLQTSPGATAVCERTSDRADLSLKTSELAQVYLSRTSLAVLRDAGLVTEHTQGALAAADAALVSGRSPFCPETF